MNRIIIRLILPLVFWVFAQAGNGQIQIQYHLYYNAETFEAPIIYLEKGYIESNKKYSFAKLLNHEKGITNKKQKNTSQYSEEFSIDIIPHLLYRLKYNIQTKASETQEPILFKSRNLDQIYTIKDTLEEIDWEISNERKTIDNLSCIKAKANFRCKTFIAWFTPEIPIHTGPWKLHGLPGLIIEAYDENKERHYLLEKYNPNVSSNKVKEIVANGKTKDTFTGNQVRAFFNKLKENLKAESKISNVDVDCVDCPNTKSTTSFNLWECY